MFNGAKAASGKYNLMGFQLSYDNKLRSYRIKTTEGVTATAMHSYWFAWSAFYKDTMVVKDMP